MDSFQAWLRFKFWLFAKLRLGVYRSSVPLRLRNLAVTVQTYSNSIDPTLNLKDCSIYFDDSWLDELSRCYKFGGYKKFLGKFYWSHKKFSYFDLKNNIFDGVPNLISSTHLLHLQDIVYFPRALRPNEVSKYTFKVKKYKSSNFDIDHAITFDLGGADSFQHFVQDCLPIILMSREFLSLRPDVVLLLPKASLNFPTQSELIRKLRITNEIVETDSKSISVKNLYFWNFKPFNAKYVLPAGLEAGLFELIRKRITSNIQDRIILITRNETTRNFANLDIIIHSMNNLAMQLELKLEIIDSSKAKLIDYETLIPQGKIIISMHGGANYNLIFASGNSMFFEFVPINETNSLINFFRYSGITYIPVPIDFRLTQASAVMIPEQKLSEIHNIAKKIIDGTKDF
jgi:hypothetical protein